MDCRLWKRYTEAKPCPLRWQRPRRNQMVKSEVELEKSWIIEGKECITIMQKTVKGCTVNIQVSWIASWTSKISRCTSVLSSMDRLYRIYTETTKPFHFHDSNSIILSDRKTIEGPSKIQRRVSLWHCALYWNSFSGIDGFIPKRKRKYLRRYWRLSVWVNTQGSTYKIKNKTKNNKTTWQYR